MNSEPSKHDYEAECKNLKMKCDDLYCEFIAIKKQYEETIIELGELKMKYDELKEQVEFYRGQIDAFKFCVRGGVEND